MFGFYRFILACMVILSHTNLNFMNFYSGVWAVTNFFVLSGYVMTAVIQNNFPHILNSHSGKDRFRLFLIDAMRFIIDRTLRIMPLFLLVVNLNLALYFFFCWPTYLMDLNWRTYILNITLIPNNYRLLIPGLENSSIIPQSTTLALEEQFFWLFPFILQFFKLRVTLVALSITIFCIALAHMPDTSTMNVGYIYLPGVLFFFVLGSNIRLMQTRSIIALLTINLILLIILHHNGRLFGAYIFERSSGALLAPLIVWLLSKLNRNKLDDMLGHISYGMFLNHYVLVTIFNTNDILATHHLIKSISILAIAIAYATVTYVYFEKPIQVFRLRTRGTIKTFCYSLLGSHLPQTDLPLQQHVS